jgi:hypothetical protein
MVVKSKRLAFSDMVQGRHTSKISPETYELALEAKNIAGPLRSKGSPHLPMGVLLVMESIIGLIRI